MGLASALSTALTGLTAAESTIDVVGNNVANSSTVGFKASEAQFATQFLQTQSLGSAPTNSNGGTNPRQTGLGVLTAEITPDFTQGTIQISSNPSDLAIQGDGFFIVQANTGEQVYTRNGIFKTNSQNELVTVGGQRLLGFGADDDFNIQETTLEPITIPLGSAAVAQATQNVFMAGTLTPNGDIATTAGIIETGVLGDAAYSRPAAATTVAAGAAGALSATYKYYVTFANATGGPGSGLESRPSPVSASVTPAAQQVNLSGIPTTAAAEWSPALVRRIYRNLGTDDTTFHFVAELTTPATTTFVDNNTDATISANPTLSYDGPPITESTLLTNVLVRDGDQYTQVFQDGTLNFSGKKGGRSLAGKELTIDSSGGSPTTVLNLLDFFEQSMGVQIPPGNDPLNPIPQSQTSGAPVNPGGSVSGSKIRLVGNNGVDNELSIGLSDMQLTTTSGTESVDMAFGTAQEAAGQGAVSDFVVYDSLGIPLNVRVTAVLQERSGTITTFRWFADSGDNDPTGGSEIAVGSGLLSFDGEGNLLSSTNTTVSIDRRHIASASPLEFELNFDNVSGLASATSSLAASRQDGSAPGTLASFIIGEDGRIRGVFSNGVTRDIAQIRLARFSNPAGLQQRGQNMYAAGVNSGLPIQGNPGEQGIGAIVSGAVELSNTDIGRNLIDLILASTAYRGNTRVIDASQRLLDELLNLRR